MAGQDAEIEMVKVSDPTVLAPSDVSAIALDFKVLHPVVITRLGVFPGGARPGLHSNVTVKLFQLDQEVTAPEASALWGALHSLGAAAGLSSVCMLSSVQYGLVPNSQLN